MYPIFFCLRFSTCKWEQETSWLIIVSRKGVTAVTVAFEVIIILSTLSMTVNVLQLGKPK